MPFRYPIALELEGCRCTVIGGGDIAEQKARGLVEAGAQVTVVSEVFTEGLEQLARHQELELVRRPYSHGDLEGEFLAIAATGDPAVNAEIFKEAQERRVLLNAVDDVEHCHFAAPAVVRRGDFAVAISTGGKAPALAKRVRRELAERFDEGYAALVDILGEVREETIRTRAVPFETWAHRWQLALDHDLIGLIRKARIDEARDVVRRCLKEGRGLAEVERPGEEETVTGRARSRGCGRVWIVGAGPGDPGLLTVRGKEALELADVVVYDRLVNPALIEGRTAIFVGKQAGHHQIPQEEINDLLVRLATQGNNVVRLKGGDPFVFGRGAEEAEALAAAGIEAEVVPAPTSAIAAPAYAGIPVTDRRFASSVAFVTGHCAGRREVDWQHLATAVDTVVVLMGLARIKEIVDRLIDGGRDPTTPAAVVENGTLPGQRVITADLADLAAAATSAKVASPAVIVVGEVVRVRERIAEFQNVPAFPDLLEAAR
jgi:uroporphyrin-III C-methyltransferase / precorrin-2 dehydrogenase / sirohydrochlorin ferrochelatase